MSVPDLTFAVIGVAALLAALVPRLVAERALSLPIVFLAVGAVLFLLPGVPVTPDPVRHRAVIEHLAEVTVIVALMGTGLRLDRPPGWRLWSSTVRLLAVTMPLTILAVAALGVGLLGLPLAAAVLLGAATAPTDPVLAGEVQVGEPTEEPVDAEEAEEAEDEVRFGLTSEAGLNDALAFPFVYLAVHLATDGTDPRRWLGEWLALDLIWRVTAAVAIGIGVGWALGRLFFRSKSTALRLSEHREGFVALAATFLAYGLTELVHGYGFLAVFVCAVSIRSSERFHGYHRVLHEFVEQIERLLTVLVLLLLGGALTTGLLGDVGWREALAVAVVLLVIRPVTGALALIGGRCGRGERAALAFFGVRGVGNIYYVGYAAGAAAFIGIETVWAVVALTVAASVVLHGLTSTPAMAVLDRQHGPAEESRGDGDVQVAR